MPLLVFLLFYSLEHVISLPNYIFLIADYLGYNDIGSYGSPTIRTPHLDQIAAEGLRFTQFYTASLCSPSRASLLTGRLPIRSGVYTNLPYPEDSKFRVFYPSSVGCMLKNETTIADFLKAKGYRTAMIGKNHVGHNAGCLPTDRGFEYFYGLPYSHEEGYPTYPEEIGWPPVPLFKDRTIVEQPVNLSSLTPRYNQAILSLLDQYAATQENFFLLVGYEQPHVPLFASPLFVNVSKRGLYGDAVIEMDDSIGQILAKLKEKNLDGNTLIFFASDNGGWISPSSGFSSNSIPPFDGGSNGALYEGKGSTYEGGMRVVAMFRWLGMIQPGISMETASMMDLVPTILEWSAIQKPQDLVLDGYSLVSLLVGKNQSSPYPYYPYWRDRTLYAIRNASFKCHFYTRSGFGDDPPVSHDPCLLYNIDWDVGEQYPLNVSDYLDVINSMNSIYQSQLADVTFGPSQFEMQDVSVLPCCHATLNASGILEALAKYGPGLEMWNSLGCVC
jgi:arylsulfatase A